MPPPSAGGAIHLFRLFGISVYLHWTWFILVYIDLQWRRGAYGSKLWNVLELVAVFGIILLHEFGHALACRSVGGRAERIVLWPLGGVAFVQPPSRPGAVLWSIVAGPLVNVVLIPVLIAVAIAADITLQHVPSVQANNLANFLSLIAFFNIVILCFNMLPIYPLDGGQIVQSLLWFFVGRSLSLRIVAVMGILAAVAGVVAALLLGGGGLGTIQLLLISVFIGWQSIHGYRMARLLAAQEQWDRPPNTSV